MIKKILLILFLSSSTIGFSQVKYLDDLSAVPNPFTTTTKIRFTSTINSEISFTIKNVLGKTLFKKNIKIKTGKNTIPFSKNNLPKGMYIYSIQNKNTIISKRLVIR